MTKLLFCFLIASLPAYCQFTNATKLRGKSICAPLSPNNGDTITWNTATLCFQTAAAGGSLANPFTNPNGALTYTASPLACLDGAIPYTQWSGIAALSGQGTRLFTVPAGWIFAGGRLETGTTFTSSGTVTTLVFSLGSAANPVGWIANFQSIPALASPYAEGGGGIGLADRNTALDVFVQANVTAGGSNLSTLTAGTMFVTACFTKGH